MRERPRVARVRTQAPERGVVVNQPAEALALNPDCWSYYLRWTPKHMRGTYIVLAQRKNGARRWKCGCWFWPLRTSNIKTRVDGVSSPNTDDACKLCCVVHMGHGRSHAGRLRALLA